MSNARRRAAAAVQTAARENVDAGLLALVGPEEVSRTRRTLAVLIDMICELEAGAEETH